MFGLGIWEIVVILAVALIVLGPRRLPGMARQLGRALREFRRATNELRYSMDEATAERSPPVKSPTVPYTEPTEVITSKPAGRVSGEPAKGIAGEPGVAGEEAATAQPDGTTGDPVPAEPAPAKESDRDNPNG